MDTCAEPVDVEYAIDLDTQVYGTGFGAWGGAGDGKAARHPWDLSVLPKLPGSLLRHMHGNIAGVTKPWLYFGMLFSAFCWHCEDHYLPALNYLHTGAPKTWYGIPAHGAKPFEKLMKAAVPTLFREEPSLLHGLVTMISPGTCLENDVPITTVLQEPGTFIVAYPQAYHAGFSHGFNCGEAVNFAPASWLPFGRLSVENYRFDVSRRPPIFAHDRLVWDASTAALEAAKAAHVQGQGQAPASKARSDAAGSSALDVWGFTAAGFGIKAAGLGVKVAGRPGRPCAGGGAAAPGCSASDASPLIAAEYVMDELVIAVREEFALRAQVCGGLEAPGRLGRGLRISFVAVADGRAETSASDKCCATCGVLPFFSMLRCSCKKKNVTCLLPGCAVPSCDCAGDAQTLEVHVRDGQLRARVSALAAAFALENKLPVVGADFVAPEIAAAAAADVWQDAKLRRMCTGGGQVSAAAAPPSPLPQAGLSKAPASEGASSPEGSRGLKREPEPLVHDSDEKADRVRARCVKAAKARWSNHASKQFKSGGGD